MKKEEKEAILGLLKSENPDDCQLGLILLWKCTSHMSRSLRYNFCIKIISSINTQSYRFKPDYYKGGSWQFESHLKYCLRKIAKEYGR